MDMDAIILSVIASVPELIVIVGACVLLLFTPVLGRRFGPLLFWSSLATVIAGATATFALAGDQRLVYSGMFVVDNFSVFFKMLFYLATGLTVLMSARYLEEEAIARIINLEPSE